MKSFLFLFLLSGIVFAQQTTINGSEHPELIPDSAAALAVFSVHSMFDTAVAIANTEKQHAKVGFSTSDHAIYDAAMRAIFSNPKSQTAVLSSLLPTLSVDGQAKLMAFIQAEKAHMQYHIQSAIEQEVGP